MATPSGDKADPKTSKSSPQNTVTQEQVVSGFQELRNQQRAIVSKIAEIDQERKEHELVIEALKEVDASRKCFRMIGGVLVERTVGVVLPALVTNHEQLGKLVETLTHQLETKGKELIHYREKYNIRVKGEEERSQSSLDTNSKTGVLVGAS